MVMTGLRSTQRRPRPVRAGRLHLTHLVSLAAAVLCAGVLLAGCAAAGPPAWTMDPVMVEPVTMPPLGARETAYDPPVPAPPLRLTDQDGNPFDLESLRGGPVFVYFGYTHCPDVCPTTLADVRAAIKQSGVPAKVVFVTIDPARDNAAAMQQYVDYYGADYTGLTGSAVQIARAATDWGVSYRQLPSDSANGYPMAHSTETYLLDADGKLRHHLFFGAGPDLIADRLTEVAGP